MSALQRVTVFEVNPFLVPEQYFVANQVLAKNLVEF
jgi:hypothetical protein